MLINNWYVAATEDDVKVGTPYRVKMLGLWFALFRSKTDQVICVNDTCSHRGGSLGLGRINNGRIACSYHGWEYNSKGRCTKIPALGDDVSIPKRARVDCYPVQIRYGWIWVFLGDLPEQQRPLIPDNYPYYEEAMKSREKWGIVHLNYDVNCNWARSEENSIDGSHPSFVHASFGSKRDPKLKIVEPVAHDWGSSTYRERPPAEYANLSKMTKQVIEKKRGNNKAYTWFSIVGVSHLIDVERSNGVRHVTFAARTPMDADNTRIFSHQVRNFLPGPEHDEERLQGRINAAAEDTIISQNVNPRYLPRTMSGELLVESDQNEAPFRRLIYKLAKRGWEIDIDEVEKQSRYKALAIPCPQRREDPRNWMAKPIPTTYPREQD